MYATVKRDTDIVYGVNEYVCNSISDLELLPRCEPGSTAIILKDGSEAVVYMKNPEGKWVKL